MTKTVMFDNKSLTRDIGRNLESIVDGNNKHSYTYDEIGTVI